MESMVRSRGVNPIIIKLGVPIGLTFAGFIVAQLSSRARPRVPSPAASTHRYSSGALSQATGRSSVGLKELRLLKGKAALATIVNGTSTTTALRLAPTKTSSGDDECDHTVKDLEASRPKNPAIEEDSATEQEIASLRSLVCSLQENERSLELQLLEYYGMQEQAAAVRDLERQLQMSSTEARGSKLSSRIFRE
ncbi:uncharacterized protein LOC135643758 [Musa acuminata AAA Group]|uniref:uncharacterized protein LOC135643758 n=1 Tax=Musa acuminata AAA Group TaxID=214697 RepID=UPI0031E0E264